MSSTDSLVKKYPGNKLLVQLYYLRAMSAGHLEKLEPFSVDLQNIITNYPKDQLITPLVKQHLAYINANTPQLSVQNFAIMDTDTAGAFFTPPIDYQKETAYNRNRKAPVYVEERVVNKPVEQAPVQNKPPVKTLSTIFSARDSTNYYFVINVNSGTTDLASSRFGIGQFIRANFKTNTITHQLKDAGRDNQLIYVGRFYSLVTVKDFAKAFAPLLPEVMKVPKDKYSFFIITQENLNKLADKKLLDDYIYYYQQTY